MSNIVHSAYNEYLQNKRIQDDREYALRHRGGSYSKPSLWPSDTGQVCKRKTILRVTGNKGDNTFSDKSLDYMNAGLVQEDETTKILRYVYGDRLTEQVELKYQMWSGKADFGIDIGTDNPIIIEHKVTSEKNWDTDNNASLPKHEHLGQVLTYKWLYEQLYGITPKTIIFYKSFGNFAEFELDIKDEYIIINSLVNGISDIRKYKFDVLSEIKELMRLYNNSSVLPEKLDKKYKGCEFFGKPSCQYYNLCWGN